MDLITEQAVIESGMTKFPENTVLLVTRSGILSHTLPVALTKVPVTINQDLKAFTPDTSQLLPDFLYLLLKGSEYRILRTCSKAGTTVASVEMNQLEKLPFLLPSIAEQTEIVRRVETLFALADDIEQQSRAAAERVALLTQSVLAKAFRGELSEQWRREHPDLISGDNSAAALLARIQAERAATGKKSRRA